nr:hypothetical protein [Tanacetum cinerariifolium]
ALQVTDTGCRLFPVLGLLFLQFLDASYTQGTVSSIPIGGSTSPEGFLLLIMMLVVIIVTVVIVVVILIVVVAIIGVVVVVGGVFIIKLSFVIIGVLCRIVFYYLIHQPLGYVDSFLESLSLRTILICQESFQFGPGELLACSIPIGVSLGPGFLLRLSTFAMAACDSRTAATPSVISCRMAASVIAGVADFGGGVIDLNGDEDPTDKDGDAEMDDSIGVSTSLGEISLEGKKSWELDIVVKDKVLLVQDQANGQVLQEEELEFLADPGTTETSSTQFVTDVKLVRDLHTTNVDQLHAYLGQHEYHANEVRLSAFAMAAACASRTTATPSVISYWIAASVIAGVTDVDVLLGGIYQHIHANIE